MIDVTELPKNLEELSAKQVQAILEDFIDNWGVNPEEISLLFRDADGSIEVAFSSIHMGTIVRTYDGETVDATFRPRSVN